MAGYVPLPAYEMPRNAMLDFSGLNAGIDAIGQRREDDRAHALRQQNAMLAKKQDARAEMRFADERADRSRNNFNDTAKRVAGYAQEHVLTETDPAKRAAKWQQLLDSHPDLKGAPDAYRDPMTGPELFVSQARGYVDPLDRQTKQAELELKQAQAGYYRQKPQGSGGATDAVARKLMEEDPSLSYLDAITLAKKGDVGYATDAKETAEARAKARADLPRTRAVGERMLEQIDAVEKDPNLANVTGWEGYLPTLQPKNVDTEERIAQLTGGAFLQAFESLKGGGQITEIEGKKATDALARLSNLKQSDAGFKQALTDFRSEVQRLLLLAEQRASDGRQPPSSPTNAPDPLGIR